ncbi:MAG: hypothetical protein G01um101429_33 [Parcubacteria group bacterium Gr01-1014_29]|nr:MAG: hypothetical protein G01um101429_33 [Parcubacteria group bacterium Gr01-1014_29]
MTIISYKFSKILIPVFAGLLSLCFLVFAALYIYSINGVAMRTFGIQSDEQRILQLKEEVRSLEVERAHLVVGSWLEQKARELNLSTAGPVYFVARDSSVAIDITL